MKIIGDYNLRRHLKAVGVFFAMACATTIYTHLDTVMLGLMTTDEDVGYYNAAVRIKAILVSIVTSLGTVLLPRVSYFIEFGRIEEFRKITKKALNYVFLTATPLMLYFIVFAKEGIYLLSGKLYVDSIVPMQLIMPTLLLIGITNVLGIQILVPLGKEKIVLYSEITGAIVNVIINAVMIPQFASVGAAIGTLVAEFLVFVVQYFFVGTEVRNLFKTIQYGKLIIALGLGFIASFWIKTLGLGNFLTLLVSFILFFGTYGIFLLIVKENFVVEICNQLLKKLKKKSKNSDIAKI